MANINENGVRCRITAIETIKAYAVQTIANIDIQRMSVFEIENNSNVSFPCINRIIPVSYTHLRAHETP